MINLFFEVKDTIPDFYFPFTFRFNGNNDIDMESDDEFNVSFADYLSASSPYVEKRSKQNEELWQQTKFYVFQDVFIN